MRISAQVISGIGFLGAGMIILKNNNVIMGLTTAAGVWTTGIIGIAVGCGFYIGAGVATVLLLLSLIIFAKVEKRRKSVEVIYLEIDDMYRANDVIEEIKPIINREFIHKMLPPKSGFQGHLGINVIIPRRLHENVVPNIRALSNVVYVEEEE
jgi:putative Mg2+ transporter-C (MgtC) family protein